MNKSVLKFKDGSVYEGEAEDNLPQGYGIKRWPNGDSYEGEFNEGKREGRGEYNYLMIREMGKKR